MKNASHIFTKMRLGLDFRVWLTMLALLIISVVVLSFKMSDSVECSPYEITAQGVSKGKNNNYYVGETVVFDAAVELGENVVWDFGDGTPLILGRKAIHKFLHDGRNIVTATLNNKCIESVTVNIRPFVPIAQPVIEVPADVIIGLDTPRVGEKVNFFSTKKAEAYEWSVLNSPEFPVITDSIATYKFIVPGNQIVVLKLNGDEHKVYRKNIIVLPAARSRSQLTHSEPTPQFRPVLKPPQIVSFTPATGKAGTIVTISGANFNGTTAVSFGETLATSFVVLTPNTISATVGNGATGNIGIINKNGQSALSASTFTFIIPDTIKKIPTGPKILFVDDAEFKRILSQVCENKANASDFKNYLCNGENTKVLANNNWMNLKELCDKLIKRNKIIIGHKNYSIKSVKSTRDAGNQNCVTVLTVNYR